jgi:lysozyme
VVAAVSLETDLIRDEGLRLKPYRCTAEKLTIGVGRNLDDVGITKDEAMVLLRNDIAEAERGLLAEFPWYLRLSEARREVLINMAFNMGIPTLKGFAKMWAALKIGKFDRAADEMLGSTWARQVGPRAQRLAVKMRKG